MIPMNNYIEFFFRDALERMTGVLKAAASV